jgi:hypothetical protein
MSEKKHPRRGMPTKLPSGVAAMWENADGTTSFILDRALRNMKWPGLRVDSGKFKDLPSHEKLYQLSQAFLHTAMGVCTDAGNSGCTLGWPQGSVFYYCLHLATELFLKACILRISGRPIGIHEIADLRHEYLKLLPGDKFHFETSWWVSAKDLDRLFGRQVLNGIDRSPDQLYRYSIDKKGTGSKSIHLFTPGYMLNRSNDLQAKWTEIWRLLSEKSR